MTTFDFSIHAAPASKNWHRDFTNDSSELTLLDLQPWGISGWGAHQAFVNWANDERIDRHTPDWCLHVAACSREQLMRFTDACTRNQPIEARDALKSEVSQLPGDRFVIRILEF
jgi:hypothetical protein